MPAPVAVCGGGFTPSHFSEGSGGPFPLLRTRASWADGVNDELVFSPRSRTIALACHLPYISQSHILFIEATPTMSEPIIARNVEGSAV